MGDGLAFRVLAERYILQEQEKRREADPTYSPITVGDCIAKMQNAYRTACTYVRNKAHRG